MHAPCPLYRLTCRSRRDHEDSRAARVNGRRAVASIRTNSGSENAEQQRNDKHDEKNEEQNLRDFGRARRDAGKAEHRGNDRDDKENSGVMKHENLLKAGFAFMAMSEESRPTR
jgi:hypothetical protein